MADQAMSGYVPLDDADDGNGAAARATAAAATGQSRRPWLRRPPARQPLPHRHGGSVWSAARESEQAGLRQRAQPAAHLEEPSGAPPPCRPRSTTAAGTLPTRSHAFESHCRGVGYVGLVMSAFSRGNSVTGLVDLAMLVLCIMLPAPSESPPSPPRPGWAPRWCCGNKVGRLSRHAWMCVWKLLHIVLVATVQLRYPQRTLWVDPDTRLANALSLSSPTADEAWAVYSACVLVLVTFVLPKFHQLCVRTTQAGQDNEGLDAASPGTGAALMQTGGSDGAGLQHMWLDEKVEVVTGSDPASAATPGAPAKPGVAEGGASVGQLLHALACVGLQVCIPLLQPTLMHFPDFFSAVLLPLTWAMVYPQRPKLLSRRIARGLLGYNVALIMLSYAVEWLNNMFDQPVTPSWLDTFTLDDWSRSRGLHQASHLCRLVLIALLAWSSPGAALSGTTGWAERAARFTLWQWLLRGMTEEALAFLLAGCCFITSPSFLTLPLLLLLCARIVLHSPRTAVPSGSGLLLRLLCCTVAAAQLSALCLFLWMGTAEQEYHSLSPVMRSAILSTHATRLAVGLGLMFATLLVAAAAVRGASAPSNSRRPAKPPQPAAAVRDTPAPSAESPKPQPHVLQWCTCVVLYFAALARVDVLHAVLLAQFVILVVSAEFRRAWLAAPGAHWLLCSALLTMAVAAVCAWPERNGASLWTILGVRGAGDVRNGRSLWHSSAFLLMFLATCVAGWTRARSPAPVATARGGMSRGVCSFLRGASPGACWRRLRACWQQRSMPQSLHDSLTAGRGSEQGLALTRTRSNSRPGVPRPAPATQGAAARPAHVVKDPSAANAARPAAAAADAPPQPQPPSALVRAWDSFRARRIPTIALLFLAILTFMPPADAPGLLHLAMLIACCEDRVRHGRVRTTLWEGCMWLQAAVLMALYLGQMPGVEEAVAKLLHSVWHSLGPADVGLRSDAEEYVALRLLAQFLLLTMFGLARPAVKKDCASMAAAPTRTVASAARAWSSNGSATDGAAADNDIANVGARSVAAQAVPGSQGAAATWLQLLHAEGRRLIRTVVVEVLYPWLERTMCAHCDTMLGLALFVAGAMEATVMNAVFVMAGLAVVLLGLIPCHGATDTVTPAAVTRLRWCTLLLAVLFSTGKYVFQSTALQPAVEAAGATRALAWVGLRHVHADGVWRNGTKVWQTASWFTFAYWDHYARTVSYMSPELIVVVAAALHIWAAGAQQRVRTGFAQLVERVVAAVAVDQSCRLPLHKQRQFSMTLVAWLWDHSSLLARDAMLLLTILAAWVRGNALSMLAITTVAVHLLIIDRVHAGRSWRRWLGWRTGRRLRHFLVALLGAAIVWQYIVLLGGPTAGQGQRWVEQLFPRLVHRRYTRYFFCLSTPDMGVVSAELIVEFVMLLLLLRLPEVDADALRQGRPSPWQPGLPQQPAIGKDFEQAKRTPWMLAYEAAATHSVPVRGVTVAALALCRRS